MLLLRLGLSARDRTTEVQSTKEAVMLLLCWGFPIGIVRLKSN
jgi:hypothetical protein